MRTSRDTRVRPWGEALEARALPSTQPAAAIPVSPDPAAALRGDVATRTFAVGGDLCSVVRTVGRDGRSHVDTTGARRDDVHAASSRSSDRTTCTSVFVPPPPPPPPPPPSGSTSATRHSPRTLPPPVEAPRAHLADFRLDAAHALASAAGPAPVAASGGEEPLPADLDPLPDWLAAQPQRLDLPTEQDALSGMDVARSLLTGLRPQANLVPQQRDTVVAIGALLPDDPDAATCPTGTAGKPADGTEEDLRPYLLSPVETAPLGPASGEAGTPPVPGAAGQRSEAIEVVFPPWAGRVSLPAPGPSAPRPQVLWLTAALLLAAETRPAPTSRRQRGREAPFGLFI